MVPTWKSSFDIRIPPCIRLKERGRNNWQVFSPVIGRRLKARVAIESHLRVAHQMSQLDVHYQPIVDIESQRVVALESLVRWKHPDYGFVSPTRFIGVAEESGLIVPIGEFVLQRVLEDTRRWLDAAARWFQSPSTFPRSSYSDMTSRISY